MKVVIGMSGGVDSSTAAYLLKRDGYEVEGLSFILMEARGRKDPNMCCSAQAVEEAAETARLIGIKHSSLDVRAEFMEQVVEPFISAYSKGITPNPCILCNRHIKFPFLLREAEKRGADFISTGHYAQVRSGPVGALLIKGIDPKKDQSYALYVLRQEELSRLILPLGNFRKEQVRAMAREFGLPASERPESQEICFVGEGRYASFIGSLAPGKEGPILDMKGNEIGKHHGIHLYTIGQRKGLGISSPHPLFVVKIDPKKNAVYAGTKEMAFRREFPVGSLNRLIPQKKDFRAGVKVRSMMKDEPATVYALDNGKVKVVYDEPQWAPAPGQSAVFYDGDIVIGGGVIEEIME
ncbi:MAG: tRNA 2-thiouridine(34) synthase MnmA [Thermodesulfovibrionales bacterium]|nr:tRNA 2-thiouridine(34) synthase MnmA [Thermodesulfovibrionales bacterium]